MSDCRAASEQVIHIGALPILAQYGLTARLKHFRNTHPEIRLLLDEGEERELLDGLEYGKYDFIIVRDTLVQGADYRRYTLAEDELNAVFPAGHPLICAQKDSAAVSLNTIAEEPFMLMHEYTSVYHRCMEEFDRLGIQPKILRTARVETIISTVAEGEALSLLPRSNLKVFQHSGIAVFPLDPPVSLNVVLAGRQKSLLPPSQKEFIRCTANR